MQRADLSLRTRISFVFAGEDKVEIGTAGHLTGDYRLIVENRHSVTFFHLPQPQQKLKTWNYLCPWGWEDPQQTGHSVLKSGPSEQTKSVHHPALSSFLFLGIKITMDDIYLALFSVLYMSYVIIFILN